MKGLLEKDKVVRALGCTCSLPGIVIPQGWGAVFFGKIKSQAERDEAWVSMLSMGKPSAVANQWAWKPVPSQCQDAPLGPWFPSSLRNLGIKHKTGMTKQEDKRLTSMLLCLTSQGFNCQGLHWEPAGCKGMQISSKRGKGMQISSKRRKALFCCGFSFLIFCQRN